GGPELGDRDPPRGGRRAPYRPRRPPPPPPLHLFFGGRPRPPAGRAPPRVLGLPPGPPAGRPRPRPAHPTHPRLAPARPAAGPRGRPPVHRHHRGDGGPLAHRAGPRRRDGRAQPVGRPPAGAAAHRRRLLRRRPGAAVRAQRRPAVRVHILAHRHLHRPVGG